MFIKAQDIYEQTRGGLDVILAWCPDAAAVFERKTTHFKFDEYDTKASCNLREHGGMYWVKNFGEDWPSMKALDLVMRRENCTFGEACKLVAKRLQLKGEGTDWNPAKLEYRAEPPDANQKEGWYGLDFKDFTTAELKSIFSVNTWSFLCMQAGRWDEEAGQVRAVEVCKKYNLHSLAGFSWVSRSKKSGEMVRHVIRSSDSYPIFCYDEGDFKKIYQPKARDEKDRFRYFGEKPDGFLHGLAIHQKIHAVAVQEQERKAETGKMAPNYADALFPDVFLCSGGSDALNLAAYGKAVTWKNSETDEFTDSQYNALKELAKLVYVLFDGDTKGREQALKIALKHLEVRTVYLPEFKEDSDRDWRGKKYKDVRDFFNKFKGDDFKKLVKNAYPLRFWEDEPKKDRKGDPVIIDGEAVSKYYLLPTLIRNFLFRNGFARLVVGTDESGHHLTEYVRVMGNVVARMTPEQVRSFVHAFMEERCLDWRLRDALSNATVLDDKQLSLLPEIELEFEDYDPRTQYLFFRNAVWKVTKDGIEESKAKDSTRYVWANEVINHNVKRLDPFFEMTHDEHDVVRMKELKKDCLFFRYLINASRVHWRKELEVECDKLSTDAQKLYRREHQFTTGGPLLSEVEQQEQMLHLAAKITAFGYCLHRYKNKANAYAIWSMDYIMDPDSSSGGTGKSMSAGALEYLMPAHVLNGRNEEEIKDRFKFEGVDKHTDLIWLDDAHKATPLNEFFSMITNFLTIPRKGQKTVRLHFQDSPKLYITSNFAPTKIDESTLRRLWFTAYSDYYHVNATGKFRERRRPFDEFGKQLFDDFTPEEWNLFFNLMAQCIVAWMRHGRIDPPIDELMVNTFRQKIGKEFIEWADVYFGPDSGRLDGYWPRYKAWTNYTTENKNSVSARRFRENLDLWARLMGYTLNPTIADGYREDGQRITNKALKEIWNPREGKWSRPDAVDEDSLEFFYFQTPGQEVRRYYGSRLAVESPQGDGLTF